MTKNIIKVYLGIFRLLRSYAEAKQNKLT